MKPKICLFGGSYDPIHAGHIHIATAAKQACGLDELIFLPAACSPFKVGRKTLFTDEQRLKLIELAIAELDWAQLSQLDLELPPPSYSWRVVERWLEERPDCELYWLMGLDQWQQLEEWARFDYLVEKLHFIVHHRGDAPEPRAGLRSTFSAGHHPASSSAIRDCLQSGNSVPADYIAQGTESFLSLFYTPLAP